MANKGKIKCRWCGEFFDEGDLSIELNMGPLCDNCFAELKSHGERLSLEDFSDEAYEEWKKNK
jgi:hypothetical protein